MAAGKWEMLCPHCGREASALPTDETKPLVPTSVYAITKRDQEESVLVMGRAYGIPSVALRYFNVYGPGQALSNPYTGVAAIFSARILNSAPPLIFEDGLQSRDFVHVSDVVRATLLAVDRSEGDFQTFNVGTGRRVPLRDLARGLAARLSPEAPIEPTLLGTFREGDIRHCFADITRIRTRLGYEPRVPVEQGYDDLVAWARTQKPADRLESAHRELSARGLMK
jgi:dTDP-L-rhamnose 4-epimerase